MALFLTAVLMGTVLSDNHGYCCVLVVLSCKMLVHIVRHGLGQSHTTRHCGMAEEFTSLGEGKATA